MLHGGFFLITDINNIYFLLSVGCRCNVVVNRREVHCGGTVNALALRYSLDARLGEMASRNMLSTVPLIVWCALFVQTALCGGNQQDSPSAASVIAPDSLILNLDVPNSELQRLEGLVKPVHEVRYMLHPKMHVSRWHHWVRQASPNAQFLDWHHQADFLRYQARCIPCVAPHYECIVLQERALEYIDRSLTPGALLRPWLIGVSNETPNTVVLLLGLQDNQLDSLRVTLRLDGLHVDAQWDDRDPQLHRVMMVPGDSYQAFTVPVWSTGSLTAIYITNLGEVRAYCVNYGVRAGWKYTLPKEQEGGSVFIGLVWLWPVCAVVSGVLVLFAFSNNGSEKQPMIRC